MAVTLTLVFLYKNKKWINTTPDDLYRAACAVAESKPAHMRTVVQVTKETFEEFLEDFKS